MKKLNLTNLYVAMFLCAAAFLFSGLACAQSEQENVVNDTKAWLQTAVETAKTAYDKTLRLEVQVGQLDPRLHLAPCGRIEPYLPAGTRLWGKTRVGLRCLEGSTRWNVFLPVTVKAWGRAWVAKGGLVVGATVAATDLMESEVDWAEDPSPVLIDPTQWLGQTVTRNLSPGQALRQSYVRPATVFNAGAQVRVEAQGAGFTISSEAEALGAGVIGQSVRLRMENGRILTGQVVDGRTVKLAL